VRNVHAGTQARILPFGCQDAHPHARHVKTACVGGRWWWWWCPRLLLVGGHGEWGKLAFTQKPLKTVKNRSQKPWGSLAQLPKNREFIKFKE